MKKKREDVAHGGIVSKLESPAIQGNCGIRQVQVVSAREVYNEIVSQVKDKWYLDWLKQHKEMFLTPGVEEGKFIAESFKVPHFQQIVGEQQRLLGQYVADPFVVACASVCNGTVVTEEAVKENAAKIPNVCQYFGVNFTNVQGFLEQKGWKF